MTLAQLKRDLQVGKSLTMTFNSLEEVSETIKSRIGKPRKILAIQTNGLTLEAEQTGKGSFLELPYASLIEYDGKTIKIYKVGKRDLTDYEKSLIENEPSRRKENEQKAINDALTDGSQTFWLDKKYYSENDANWRWVWYKGLRWDINENKMWDKKIKGDLDLEYTLN